MAVQAIDRVHQVVGLVKNDNTVSHVNAKAFPRFSVQKNGIGQSNDIRELNCCARGVVRATFQRPSDPHSLFDVAHLNL